MPRRPVLSCFHTRLCPAWMIPRLGPRLPQAGSALPPKVSRFPVLDWLPPMKPPPFPLLGWTFPLDQSQFPASTRLRRCCSALSGPEVSCLTAERPTPTATETSIAPETPSPTPETAFPTVETLTQTPAAASPTPEELNKTSETDFPPPESKSPIPTTPSRTAEPASRGPETPCETAEATLRTAEPPSLRAEARKEPESVRGGLAEWSVEGRDAGPISAPSSDPAPGGGKGRRQPGRRGRGRPDHKQDHGGSRKGADLCRWPAWSLAR